MEDDAFPPRPGYHRYRHSQQIPSQQVFNQATAVARQAQLYDGKRMRKNIQRKTVDYNSTIIRHLEVWRNWQRDKRDYLAVQPDPNFVLNMHPSPLLSHNPSTSVAGKFIQTSINKHRFPIFCCRWTPEGRRLVTGSASGEFTLWNGLTFNFETISQCHEGAVRAMIWSHNDSWMVTADQSGYIKYWQSNMNNLQEFVAHKDNAVRDLSFSPTDTKLASCSDDKLIKIWDFATQVEEKRLEENLWDVKSIDWHPVKGLLASGSKDYMVKLWDPKTGK
ncbi:WD repeat-containing protein 33, partial [Nowakowskiella sp. JEL0078]